MFFKGISSRSFAKTSGTLCSGNKILALRCRAGGWYPPPLLSGQPPAYRIGYPHHFPVHRILYWKRPDDKGENTPSIRTCGVPPCKTSQTPSDPFHGVMGMMTGGPRTIYAWGVPPLSGFCHPTELSAVQPEFPVETGRVPPPAFDQAPPGSYLQGTSRPPP